MKCSFCSKSETEVKKLIAGNDKTAICDECIIESLKLLVYGEPEPLVINLQTSINNVL